MIVVQDNISLWRGTDSSLVRPSQQRRKKNGSMRSFLLLFLLLTSTSAALAADSSVELKAQTADGRSSYRIGERIRLKLSFSASEAGHYEVDEAGYDRSGRMYYEGFHVIPAKGWSDPLKEYFENRLLSIGGLRGYSDLAAKSFIIEIDLNEWVRFEQPGIYTVQVYSGRISDKRSHRKGKEKPVTIKSNSITLQIVPAEKEWQQKKLAEIAATLANTPIHESDSDSSPRYQAASDLRFLDTEEAVDLMTRYYRYDEHGVWGQCEMGLLGLPAQLRASAVASLKKRIAEPNFPVFTNVINTLAFLQSKVDNPGPTLKQSENLKTLPWDSPEEMKDQEEAWNLIYLDLDKKEGAARTETLKTLFEWHPEHTSPETVHDLNRRMTAELLNLGSNDQQQMLNFHWDVLHSREIVPLLRKLAAPWPVESGSKEMQAAYRGYLQATAFFRWYEIDPAGAHEEIQRQIGSAHPTLYADAVDFLPNESLPQFEKIWADALKKKENENRQGVLLSLMARFGTGVSVVTVRETIQGKLGYLSCREQSAALAYLVRFDEANAAGIVEAAVAARGPDKTGCNNSVFTDVGEYVSNSMLLAEAVKALDDPDNEVVLDALHYLTAHGDQSVKEPIREHYIQWSDHWKNYKDRLEYRKAGELGPTQGVELGKDLVDALMANQGWIPSDEDLEADAHRCVGEDVCNAAAEIQKKSAEKPVPISFWDTGERPRLTLAQFTPKTMELLEGKVRQFPRGTRFHVYQFGETKIKNQELKQRIVKMLENAGMEIQ